MLALILIFSKFLDGAESTAFVSSAIYGLLTFLLVEVLGGFLDKTQETTKAAAQVEGRPVVEVVDELVPSMIAGRIRDLAERTDALAIVQQKNRTRAPLVETLAERCAAMLCR